MKILSQKFFKMKTFYVKYLITDQLNYLEEMYSKLVNFVDIYYWQYYNVLILLE